MTAELSESGLHFYGMAGTGISTDVVDEALDQLDQSNNMSEQEFDNAIEGGEPEHDDGGNDDDDDGQGMEETAEQPCSTLTNSELQAVAGYAQQDAINWYQAYLRAEQEKEALRAELSLTVQKDMGQQLIDAHTKLYQLEGEVKERTKAMEQLSNNLMASQRQLQMQQAQIEELHRELEAKSANRNANGQSQEEQTQSLYYLLTEMEGQLVSLQAELAFKTREVDTLRSQLDSERGHARGLQEELAKRDRELSKVKAQLTHMQHEKEANAAKVNTELPRYLADEDIEQWRRMTGHPAAQQDFHTVATVQPPERMGIHQAMRALAPKPKLNGVMLPMDRSDGGTHSHPASPQSPEAWLEMQHSIQFGSPQVPASLSEWQPTHAPEAPVSSFKGDPQQYRPTPHIQDVRPPQQPRHLPPHAFPPGVPTPQNYLPPTNISAADPHWAGQALPQTFTAVRVGGPPMHENYSNQPYGNNTAPDYSLPYPSLLPQGEGQSGGRMSDIMPKHDKHIALDNKPSLYPMLPKPGDFITVTSAATEGSHVEYYSNLDPKDYAAMAMGNNTGMGMADYGNPQGMYTVASPSIDMLGGSLVDDGTYSDTPAGRSNLQSISGGNTQSFKLMKSLQAAATQAQVVDLALQLPVEQLDVVSICTIMNRLAKVSHNKCAPGPLNLLISKLLKQALTMVDTFEHQHASNILHAVAKLNIKDARFVSVMKERLMHPSVVNELNPQDIANTVWALATLHTTNNKLIEVLTQRAMVPSVLNQFNSQHVTNIAWAMAKLGIVNTTLLNALADRAMCPEVLNNFNAQGVANTIWACAKSGFVHLKLMNALAERAMHPEVLHHFISQNLANIAWGWAKLALLDERLMHALANRAIEPSVLANFNTQEVANMTWAFARLGVLNEPLLLALAERAMHPGVLSKYTSQDLGNTSWAFAKLGVLHEPLMDALAERCLCPDVAATFNTQNVANVAWAYARLGIRNVPLMSMLAQRSMCRPVMYRFKPHQIGNTVWSFAKLGILNKPLMDALSKRAMDPSVISTFQAQDIANVLWAFATLELMTPQLLRRMEERALDAQVLSTFSQQDIATTVMAYAKLGIHNAELLEALGRRALEAGILQESPQITDDY